MHVVFKLIAPQISPCLVCSDAKSILFYSKHLNSVSVIRCRTSSSPNERLHNLRCPREEKSTRCNCTTQTSREMHKNPLSWTCSYVSATLKVMQHLNSTVTNDFNRTACRDNKMCCTHRSVICKVRSRNMVCASCPTFLHMLTWGLDTGCYCANNSQATWCLLSLSPCVVRVLSYCTLRQEHKCLTWTNHLQHKHQTQPLTPTFCSPSPLLQSSSDFSLILSCVSVSALTATVKFFFPLTPADWQRLRVGALLD